MTNRVTSLTICDVCSNTAHGNNAMRTLEFKDSSDHIYKFHACTPCLSGGGINRVYKFITELFKRSKDGK